MALKIEESFEVQAPIARAWEYLTDPQRVVTCLPGAELTEVRDERTFEGRIRVRVGPVTASYKGTARLEETDEAEHRMQMSGEGRETGGSGSARMTMVSTLAELPGGGTQVRVEAEVDVVGKIVQFGRGLMEEVSRQLFKQFASCVQAQLAEAGPAAAAQPEGDSGGTANQTPASPTTARARATGGSSAGGAATGAATMPPAAAMAAASVSAPPLATPTGAAEAPRPRRPRRAPRPHSQTSEASGREAVSALPLLLKAVSAMARRFISRILGR